MTATEYVGQPATAEAKLPDDPAPLDEAGYHAVIERLRADIKARDERIVDLLQRLEALHDKLDESRAAATLAARTAAPRRGGVGSRL